MITKFKNHPWLYFSTTSCHPLPPSLFPHFQIQQQVNDLLSSLCKQKRFHEALRAFNSLQTQGSTFRLLPSTYAHLFLACSQLKSIHHGRLVHRHLSASSMRPDIVLSNHILNMYGKCGFMEEARKLFEEMPEINIVSWTSMISGFSQNCRENEAVDLYIRMLRSGLAPDQFALGSVVRTCAGLLNFLLGRQLHGHAVKSGYGSDRIVQNALVTMYSRADSIDDASLIFQRISDKDLISWGSMIAGFAQQGCELNSLYLFKEMINSGGCSPNEFHFGSAFSACGNINQLEFGQQLHGLCFKLRLDTEAFAGCSLSDMYARCRNLYSAKKAFYQIDMPDLVSWNSIIGAYSNAGLVDEAIVLFLEMRWLGLKPDDITVRCLLCACSDYSSLYQGQLVHSYLLKVGLDADVSVCNALLSMYTRCSDIFTALNLFEEIKAHDLISWNSILTACVQHRQLEEAFQLFKCMRSSMKDLDHITLNTILSACADLASFDIGKHIHAYSFKVGLETDIMVRNGLIDAYAKCGSLDDARKLFEMMGNNRDVFSWSSLIVGYAQFGYVKESLELFALMRSLGINPNHVTLVGVLTACSRVGFVNEGLYYYNIMEHEYGIVPTKEHSSCVIDLLARAGRLDEAAKFIDQMPFEPDIVMWKTLLAACRVRNNVEIGKRAAEAILKIDPSDSAAYVLLCSIYASSGHWDEFAMLKKLMKSSGVRKFPGKSWIKCFWPSIDILL
ncbi:pentatricopeptide repeat-containing protein At3g53360, mitochondrial isoform X2 [Ananas comosus]|uniref:Pentatricopeptide repeat-containing protein At3g53360, mitochondrial isoform X2 n=1 Tax=Ananas comosus TaxID=4615 RepID=A0A6P5GJV5_ANACO|nr:pentatricopeptide repeat-containing protein At3g53360, mitochondrial isoform X2 [Ananas comosus]XP_020108966.1 pentatricopeptide repeat-containing protein At3g53360, mitochondrial isoform X2 [Ananas comosus]